MFRRHHSKRASHSAATRVEYLRLSPGKFLDQPRHKRRIQNRFRVTMRVNRDRFFALPKSRSLWLAFEKIVDKFFEKKTASRDGFGAGDLQLAIILDEHRVARGLKKQNWSVGAPIRTGVLE